MWKLPLLEVRISTPGSVDTHIVGVFQDLGKKAILPKSNFSKNFGELVEKLRKADVFQAKRSTTHFVRFGDRNKDENILFLGLGGAEDLSIENMRTAGGIAWSKLVAEKAKNAVVWIDSLMDGKQGKGEIREEIHFIRAFAEGLILNAYQINKHKSKSLGKLEEATNAKKKPKGKSSETLKEKQLEKEEAYFGPSQILFLTQNEGLESKLKPELADVQAMGEAIRITRDWSNEPSNIGTPLYYADAARNLAKQYGLKCRILTEQEAKRENMGLFLGVGQGSERESRLVVIEYIPKSQSRNSKTIALVGKGVTFDSGGISIKPSARMEEMKHDMTGAATVMGAILLASRWKISNRVIGIMAFVENMPDGNAIQPGNILTARNGKTVEVINTDAEGRLILADVLDFAQDFKPNAIIDVATLTGAVSIALGKYCCAILGNDQGLIDSLRRAGDSQGERIWQLPLFDEYFEDMKSDYADMKNAANDPNGGTIRGAIFLKQFIKKGMHWAHLDIASTAYNLGHSQYLPKKGASGAYVRTLAKFVADF